MLVMGGVTISPTRLLDPSSICPALAPIWSLLPFSQTCPQSASLVEGTSFWIVENSTMEVPDVTG